MAARRAGGVAAGASLLLVMSACQSLLDVKNPNNVDESALANPAAAAAEANGLLGTTTRMLGTLTAIHGEASDELDWVGSYDAVGELDRGVIGDYVNQMLAGAFSISGTARYLTDMTIARIEGFIADGKVLSKTDLLRSYVYGAIVYSTIADTFDDFAFSDKTKPAPAIGRTNMSQLYDKAIGFLDKAYAIATSNTDKYNILALRARIKHGKAVWKMLTPTSKTAPANPLVADAGATADATAAIALGTADAAFDIVVNQEASGGENVWGHLNGRQEDAPGQAYVVNSRSTINRWIVALKDPITNAPDTRLQARITAMKNFGSLAGTVWMTNTRELRLILAEAALAGGNTTEFTNQINQVRTLDAKPAFSGQIDNLEMLKYERKVELWMMRRRLMDMYRFGIKDPLWQPDANFPSAFDTVGLLFPISQPERLANPCIMDASKCSK